MVSAMKDLERTWNHKFNYPWMFFNDEPFTEEFKQKTQAVTKAKCFYGMLICPKSFHSSRADGSRRIHP